MATRAVVTLMMVASCQAFAPSFAPRLEQGNVQRATRCPSLRMSQEGQVSRKQALQTLALIGFGSLLPPQPGFAASFEYAGKTGDEAREAYLAAQKAQKLARWTRQACT